MWPLVAEFWATDYTDEPGYNPGLYPCPSVKSVVKIACPPLVAALSRGAKYAGEGLTNRVRVRQRRFDLP